MFRKFVFGFLLLAGPAAQAAPANVEQVVARQFDSLRDDPLRLHMFLVAMPKGGDLHNHLSGAVYAETYLKQAITSGMCIDLAALAITRPPCVAPVLVARDAFAAAPGLWDRMIDALSMRDYVPTPTDRSGHDHFFATFARFDPATDDRGAMLAEEAQRAAAENVSYLEVDSMPQLREAIGVGLSTPWKDDDFATDLAVLRPKLDALVKAAEAETDQSEARKRGLLGCAALVQPPACKVTIRYQGFTLRSLPPRAVFAQAALAAMLAAADPRYVGVNIVAPEDNSVALADYTLHMRMLAYLKTVFPGLHYSLHAGELAPGLVPPAALRFHIRQAVEIAGAERIGHGVDIAYEDDAAGLLREMAAKHVTVEINETSNAQILGISGRAHPFGLYRANGVPVVISTDDEGVERIDMTHEYERAALTWHLGYRDLKQLARASIRDSFLPGAPLPVDPSGTPLPPSRALLVASDKASAQWRLEQEFAAFETRQAAAHSPG